MRHPGARPRPAHRPRHDRGELAAYGGLVDRPRLVALNKIDVPEARELAELVAPDIQARGIPTFLVSAATHEGLRELTYAMAELVATARRQQPIDEPTRLVLRPTPVDDDGFTVTRTPDRFVVRGVKPERWVRQTDFSNDEAVGYLADRLARLGVDAELTRLGAEAGDEVVVGSEADGVVFDWEPSLEAGVEHRLGPRGSDLRLEELDR